MGTARSPPASLRANRRRQLSPRRTGCSRVIPDAWPTPRDLRWAPHAHRRLPKLPELAVTSLPLGVAGYMAAPLSSDGTRASWDHPHGARRAPMRPPQRTMTALAVRCPSHFPSSARPIGARHRSSSSSPAPTRAGGPRRPSPWAATGLRQFPSAPDSVTRLASLLSRLPASSFGRPKKAGTSGGCRGRGAALGCPAKGLS